MPGASRFGTTAGGCTGRMLTPSSDASSGMELERRYVQDEEELVVGEGVKWVVCWIVHRASCSLMSFQSSTS
jgi:hypothetical protein